jgi:hypothetical protein
MSSKNARRKSKKRDPDIERARRCYLSALQCYTPEFFYTLCDFPAEWLGRFNVRDRWLVQAATATRAYWHDRRDVIERMQRRRELNFDLASAEAGILDEVRKQGRKIKACELTARVSDRLVKLYGFRGIEDFLVPWFVLGVPESDSTAYVKQPFEFCFAAPEHRKQKKFTAEMPISEWEPIDDYKERAWRAFGEELNLYCRRFAPYQYSDWDDDLSLYAKWTALMDSRNWIDGKLAKKRTSENLAKWYGCLDGHKETTGSNIRRRVGWFRVHIGLSTSVTQ